MVMLLLLVMLLLQVPTLSEPCRALADVAEPPDMRAAFDTSLTFALVQVGRCVWQCRAGGAIGAGHRSVCLQGAGPVRGLTRWAGSPPCWYCSSNGIALYCSSPGSPGSPGSSSSSGSSRSAMLLFAGALSRARRKHRPVPLPPVDPLPAPPPAQSQLTSLESSTGLSMLQRGRNGQATGISLTGWTAILGMAALLLLAAAGVLMAYRRYNGSPQSAGYTLVLKKSQQ
jgi:hypothetical protein